MHRPRPAAAALLIAFGLLAGTAQAAKPSRPPAPAATIPAFGAGALKAEWLAGYNGAEGLDPHGLADLDTMSANGMGLYRARFRQDRVVVNGVASEWTQLDNLVRQAALRGVTILPVLIDMPGEAYTPPKTDAARSAFGDFAAAAARRYGSAGSFWGTCGCPARPIRAWEVWNEPNMSVFWQAPDPAQYAQLLALTRTKLRRTDAAARIVFGGLAPPATPPAPKPPPPPPRRPTSSPLRRSCARPSPRPGATASTRSRSTATMRRPTRRPTTAWTRRCARWSTSSGPMRASPAGRRASSCG